MRAMAWPARRARLVVSEVIQRTDDGASVIRRYEADPQLAVVESYALDVIGELTPAEVCEAADAVTGLFGEASDWRSCLRKRFGWDACVDADIADNWRRLRHAARRSGSELDPAEFARRFADVAVRMSRT